MKNSADNGSRKQVVTTPARRTIAHVLLPMVAGIAATRRGLMHFVHQAGLVALNEVLEADVERLAGPKGKHAVGRTHNRWGSTHGSLSLGGRRVSLKRPRVRSTDGLEAPLGAWDELAQVDPMPERVVEQILLGVSTRGYERSLEPLPPTVPTRGTSKSAVGRQLVARTIEKAREYLARKLNDVNLVALFLDGIEVAGHTVVVALGVALDGAKVPLGLWVGSTENHQLCTALLHDLIERGLRLDERVLCVIDGGKGIRKALEDVLGERAVIQRCQLHKLRNVLSYLPDARHPYVRQAMREAYRSESATLARKRLQQLVSWLESNGEEAAAASLREGMEETLTVLKLGLGRTLTRSFSTTNAIENMNSTIRRVVRNVKRWRGAPMAKRWVALGIAEAHKKFRRIKGHREMPVLVTALRRGEGVDSTKEVA
jgi:transposase-like protein